MTLPALYSIILVLLTALAAGLVGSFALMKRMSLAGDVISHIALPGLGLALLFHFNPLVGAAATLFLGTLLIWRLQQVGTLTTDVAIGVIFTAAVVPAGSVGSAEHHYLYLCLSPQTDSSVVFSRACRCHRH